MYPRLTPRIPGAFINLMKTFLILSLSLLALTACKQQAQSSDPISNVWLGKWNGPEGTALTIAPTGAGYNVTIQNLDGPRVFPVSLKNDALVFTRDHVEERIRPGTGTETGMKWLADKKNCLVVKPGEGYCR